MRIRVTQLAVTWLERRRDQARMAVLAGDLRVRRRQGHARRRVIEARRCPRRAGVTLHAGPELTVLRRRVTVLALVLRQFELVLLGVAVLAAEQQVLARDREAHALLRMIEGLGLPRQRRVALRARAEWFVFALFVVARRAIERRRIELERGMTCEARRGLMLARQLARTEVMRVRDLSPGHHGVAGAALDFRATVFLGVTQRARLRGREMQPALVAVGAFQVCVAAGDRREVIFSVRVVGVHPVAAWHFAHALPYAPLCLSA